MRPDIMKAFEPRHRYMWPGVITLPSMVDGRIRRPVSARGGHPHLWRSGLLCDRDDVRAHGRDERMGVQSFYEGQTFLYELVKKLSTPEN